ncbi:MAG: siphovirus Gp157 family protein [Bacteroidales bacterium]|nr:siphovirus Gp157 family protein [Bacteroidales bacterium]
MSAIEDALWENGGELTPELEQALVETEQSLATKVDGYNHLIRSFSSKADIIDAEIKRLTALKKTAENAEKRLKQHICDTMGMFGIDKLEGAYCKISRARTSKVETNEELLTSGYASNLAEFNKSLPPYITAEFKVSKTAIKDMQKSDGVLPAGAEIVENWSIRIR